MLVQFVDHDGVGVETRTVVGATGADMMLAALDSLDTLQKMGMRGLAVPIMIISTLLEQMKQHQQKQEKANQNVSTEVGHG